MSFDYILEKIKNAQITEEPFRHIFIKDLFSPEHFEQITKAQEISLKPSSNDDELFDTLSTSNYKFIEFPGSTLNKKEYINWHKNKSVNHLSSTACEGFGMVFRLQQASSDIIKELNEFLNSDAFQEAMGKRLGIDYEKCNYDAGIQKYLDGYEISPHPDIRRKAMTYMVNINPDPNSADQNYHTHYMTFTPQRNYVKEFWSGNTNVDRCWVPWDWCETKKTQSENNSIVIFCPDNDTLHAVKADYDHLKYQRTQLYGNFWHKAFPEEGKRLQVWEDLDLKSIEYIPETSLRDKLKSALPSSVVETVRELKNKIKSDKNERGDREF